MGGKEDRCACATWIWSEVHPIADLPQERGREGYHSTQPSSLHRIEGHEQALRGNLPGRALDIFSDLSHHWRPGVSVSVRPSHLTRRWPATQFLKDLDLPPVGMDQYCFNSYHDTGYGSSFWSGYSRGGGSRKYGKSGGGCFDGPERVPTSMLAPNALSQRPHSQALSRVAARARARVRSRARTHTHTHTRTHTHTHNSCSQSMPPRSVHMRRG